MTKRLTFEQVERILETGDLAYIRRELGYIIRDKGELVEKLAEVQQLSHSQRGR